MTIVYVYPALAERGGVERIIAEKLNWLSSMFGYHVCLITYNQGQHALSFPLQPQVQHVDLDVRTHAQYQYSGCRRLYESWRRSRLLRQRLGSELKRLQPDAVVTTTSGEIGLLLQLKGKAALVIESHGGYHHLPAVQHEFRHDKQQARRMRKPLPSVPALHPVGHAHYHLRHLRSIRHHLPQAR